MMHPSIFGYLAEFDSPTALVTAAEKVYGEGYRKIDTYTPFPIEAASEAASRHLVLFVVIGQPDLKQLASAEPDSISAMYRSTAAQETLHRREVLLAKLRQCGALAVEVSSAKTAVTVVNSYLDVKQRSLL